MQNVIYIVLHCFTMFDNVLLCLTVMTVRYSVLQCFTVIYCVLLCSSASAASAQRRPAQPLPAPAQNPVLGGFRAGLCWAVFCAGAEPC